MSIYFFDASAIVKRYIREPGSLWVREICEARDEDQDKVHIIAIAEISRVEVAAAFGILVRRNEIPKSLGKRAYEQFTDEIDQEYQPLRLTPGILRDAANLTQRHPLKAYDAVQLAVALDFNETVKQQDLSMIFVSGDDALLQAARAEGMATENPFDHRDLDTAR